MPKFQVKAKSTSILTTIIEADNLERAQEMAGNIDGGEFVEDETTASFDIFSIKPIEPEREQVKVFFERQGYAEHVATFDGEDLYMACLPILEYHAKKNGFTDVTESVGE